MYYFDLLPQELISLICLKMGLLTFRGINLLLSNATEFIRDFGIKSIKKTLYSPSFWTYLVKETFKDIPVEYIPTYFYNYTGQDIVSVISNYHTLTNIYSQSKRLVERNGNWMYNIRLRNINNIQLLISIIKPYYSVSSVEGYKTSEDLYKFLNEIPNDIKIIKDKSNFKISIRSKSFDITKNIMFGLLLHILILHPNIYYDLKMNLY